jgi:hypothetical protein
MGTTSSLRKVLSMSLEFMLPMSLIGSRSLAHAGMGTPLDEGIDLTMVKGLMAAVAFKPLESIHRLQTALMSEFWVPTGWPVLDIRSRLRSRSSQPELYDFLGRTIRWRGWKESNALRWAGSFSEGTGNQFAKVDFIGSNMHEYLAQGPGLLILYSWRTGVELALRKAAQAFKCV